MSALLSLFPIARALAACGSGAQILSVNLSVASAAPGQSISATVVYDQTGGWNQMYLLGAFNSTSTNITTCGLPANVQDFVLYSGAAGNGDNTAPAGMGYGPLVVADTTAVTQIFNVTVPTELTTGSTYNFIVAGSGCDAECADTGNLES